jgi:WD domain, G-beta repeat
MLCLAIYRANISIQKFKDEFFIDKSIAEIRNGLNNLAGNSFIISDSSGYTQNPTVMQCVTQRIIKEICNEILCENFSLITQYALIKTDLRNSVKKAQIDEIILPIISELTHILGSREAVTDKLKNICVMLQGTSETSTRDYTAGNIVNILIHQEIDLRGLNLSSLHIQHGYFQGIKLPHVNFSNSTFEKCVFSQAFSNILSVAFSEDGKQLAASDTGGKIFVWDISGEAKLDFKFTLTGHDSRVWSVIFSPNRELLASGSDDKTIRLWNLENGVCLYTLPLQQLEETSAADSNIETDNRVFSISFSPDGSLLASSGSGKEIKIWDLQRTEFINTIRLHEDKIMSVIFSPNSQTGTQLIASCSEDEEIRLWDIKNNKLFDILDLFGN